MADGKFEAVMDEIAELIGLIGRVEVALLGHTPGFEAHIARNCVLALTGEPFAGFNTLTLGPSPDVEGFLARSVARARERGLPLLAMMSPHVAESLAPAATRLGLRPIGTAPVMVLRAATPVQPTRPIEVVRALGPTLVAGAGDIVSRAFANTPRDAVARAFDAGINETAGVEWYVALADGRPASAVCITPAGATAGIWNMATPPEVQRQGWGRALLTRVIDDYRRRGVERFFLTASNAGRPLYDSLGFEPIGELSEWVLDDAGSAKATMMRAPVQFSVTRADDDPRAAGQQIGTLLGRFNAEAVGGPSGEPFVLSIKASGSDEILGGLRAVSYWGSFYISDVVVPETVRRQRLGSELMRQAEQEARARGCRHMWLDTFEFQARPFYERLGFEVFGRLDGLEPFFPRYFMKKTLEPPRDQ